MASKAALGVIAAAGVALGLVAYDVQVDNLGPYTTKSRSMAIVAVAWAFLFSGLSRGLDARQPEWGRSWSPPASRSCCASCATAMTRALFTVSSARSQSLAYALVAHVTLAYPSGRIKNRIERAFVKTAYAVAIAFPLLTLLFFLPREKADTAPLL